MFFALRFCDVLVLPCLVEIVTLNTVPQCMSVVVSFPLFSTLGMCCM